MSAIELMAAAPLTNDLVLKDPYVSAHHCLIERKGPCFLLSDLGSRNGTFVAGARVMGAELQPGRVSSSDRRACGSSDPRAR